MEKKFERKKTNRNDISYGKIQQNKRDFDIDTDTITKKKNTEK